MPGVGLQRRRQATQVALVLAFARQPAGLQEGVDVGNRRGSALGIPDALDCRAERGVAVVVQRFAGARHLGQQRQDHFHVGVDIDDHRERIEAQGVAPLVRELDELAVEQVAEVLVRSPDVDDPHLGAGAEVAIGHFVYEDRLAGTRQRRDREIEVAAGVVEEIEAEHLAAPAKERHDRRRRAFPLGDQRRHHHCVVGGLGADPPELTHVRLQGGRQRHRQGRCQRLVLQIEILGEIETAGAPDRTNSVFAASCLRDLRQEADLVIHPDHRAAAVEGLEHHVPVALAFLQIGLEVRHVGAGALCRAGRFDLRLASSRLVVKRHCPHGDQERARHRQGQLVGVADQGVHARQTKVARVLTNREELQHRFVTAGLTKANVAVAEPRGDLVVRDLVPEGLCLVPFDRAQAPTGE
ncbi:MAG: hypothetical protein AW10_01834 [Candidatus Accumulibacter appositus]|uniref:Uncharacterized protein n=1 Tax=Candidatus Accumulibacter appositus TaxID=1454003 RepID=A0A011NYL1_9PROT|nr:MAG: hypothetical protein AW10_01834 [Candidatus Accumulibacter appositus]